jgi:hypothetical protein
MMVSILRIALALAVGTGSLFAQESRTLRYDFQPGEVFHYDIEMSNTFTAGETRNQETIRGIETLVVTERDGETITVLPLAFGMRIVEVSVHGQDLDAYGEAHRDWPDPFFGTGLRFESPSDVPPLVPLGKVMARFSETGSAPPEAMVPRFWSLVALLGEYLQNYVTLAAYPWALLPPGAVSVDDTWVHTLPGAPDTFHYVYEGLAEEAGIPCDRVRGKLSIAPDISSSWGAAKGTEIETALCLARDGGFPVTEEFRSRSLGDVGENVQAIRATLLRRARLDEGALGIVRAAADTTFPALGRPGPDPLQDLIGRPAPALELRGPGGKPRRLSDFAGWVVVAHFWAPWSSQGAQTLAAARAATGSSDVALVPVLVEDEAAHLLGLGSVVLPQMDASLIGYHTDPDGIAAFHANAIMPVTVVLDREGIVRQAYAGYVGESELEAAVAELVAGSTP